MLCQESPPAVLELVLTVLVRLANSVDSGLQALGIEHASNVNFETFCGGVKACLLFEGLYPLHVLGCLCTFVFSL